MNKGIQDLHADIIACFLALSNALERKKLLTKQEITEACQERLLTLTVDHAIEHPLILLRAMAKGLPKASDL